MDTLDVENIMNIFQKELEIDLKMDELSIKEKAMLAPTIKHKWVARTTNYKLQLLRLTKFKRDAIIKMTADSRVPLSKTVIENAVATDVQLSSVTDNIQKVEQIIQYLEKIEKLTTSLTYDYKNVIDLQKLETT